MLAHIDRGGALVTDLYELNMAASFLRRGMVGPATFSLYVRVLPPEREFLAVAGLEDCLAHLEHFHFVADELAWLRGAGFAHDTVDAFAALRFTGDVWAVPEGRVVLANEPILEVTAPIAEAQLAETFLLNQVTFQTAIATKAVRCKLAAGPIELADFALRRTHGVEAGMAVTRAAALAGFGATSNVEAARRFGLPVTGTMAHSFIEAFPSEAEAFRAFAEDFPERVTFLVDTYNTRRGVETAIAVIREFGLGQRAAIRIDSGDLVDAARDARRRLDEAGLPQVRIFVSGGLDERDLARFVREQAPIDAAGIGTRLGVSADAPYLDSVYKLTQFGDRPVRKMSEHKSTLPGPKQVWRRGGNADLLSLRDEAGPAGFAPLLELVMRGGARVAPPFSLEAARHRLADDLAAVPPSVRISDELVALADKVAPEEG